MLFTLLYAGYFNLVLGTNELNFSPAVIPVASRAAECNPQFPENPFNLVELSPECSAVWQEMWESSKNLQIAFNNSIKFFWWQHSTGYGDQQMGLIDKCNEHDGEYCTITKIDSFLETLTLGSGGIKSGCCIPPQCATDERDIKVRVLLCDPQQYAFLDHIESNPLPNISLSFKNATVSCGSGTMQLTTGTLLVYALIVLLAVLVCFASFKEYYSSSYEGEKTIEEIQRMNAKMPELLRAFSFQKNWKALMERPERPTNFLDGIRAMSFMWVVMGHTVSTQAFNAFSLRTYDNLSFVANNAGSDWYFIFFNIAALFAVDSFFWLGGFLFAYLFSKKLLKMKNPIRKSYYWWPMLYVQRWLRLAPAVIFSFLLAWLVIPTWLDSTVPAQTISNYKEFEHNCSKWWWEIIFFLSTIDSETLSHMDCMGHTWYLSAEFIMVWFTPFLFLCWLWHPLVGICSAVVGILVGISSTWYVVDHFNIGGSMLANPAYGGQYYFRPYTRCGAYFVGFGFGFLCRYLEKRNQGYGRPGFSITPPTSTVFQVFGCLILFLLATLQHYAYPNGIMVDEWTRGQDDVWNILCRPLWGVGLSILTFSMLYGPRGGFIANFLSWSFWAPISKLSFSAYLIHYPLYDLRCASIVDNQHYSKILVLETWLGHTTWALFAAMWIWILVEAPFATLSKKLLSLCEGKKKNKELPNDVNQPFLIQQKPASPHTESSTDGTIHITK